MYEISMGLDDVNLLGDSLILWHMIEGIACVGLLVCGSDSS